VTVFVRGCGILAGLFGAMQQIRRFPDLDNLSQIFAASAHQVDAN
jgi:hypothetical protein